MMSIPIKIPNISASKRALVDDEDFTKLNAYKWRLHTEGYAYRRTKKAMIYMHRLIVKTPKNLETDHINGNKLDNRKENLRACTTQQNQRNSRRKMINKTGVIGVYKHPNGYIAQIKRGGKNVHLGLFETIEKAAQARVVVAKTEYGRFYPHDARAEGDS